MDNAAKRRLFLDISKRYMKKYENCFEFSLIEHIKQDRPGKVFGNVRLYKYPIKERCVYETLEFYLKATENIGAQLDSWYLS